MDNKLQNICDDFVRSAGDVCSSFGINRIIGQIYALLFMSPKALSLDDMTGRLRVSKGTISTNVRVLENWGAVKKVWVRSSRKDYYQANIDTIGIIMERVKAVLERRLDEISRTMGNLGKEIKDNNFKGEDSKTARIYRERIQSAGKMVDSTKALLKNISKVRTLFNL